MGTMVEEIAFKRFMAEFGEAVHRVFVLEERVHVLEAENATKDQIIQGFKALITEREVTDADGRTGNEERDPGGMEP